MPISNVDVHFQAGQIDADAYAFVRTGENVTGQALVSLSHSQPNYASVDTLSCELATVAVVVGDPGHIETRVGYRIHLRFKPVPTESGYVQVKLFEEVFDVTVLPLA